MIVIECTNEEYRALVSLVDLGVKSGGIAVATAAAVLLKKFTEAEKAAATKAEAQPLKAVA